MAGHARVAVNRRGLWLVWTTEPSAARRSRALLTAPAERPRVLATAVGLCLRMTV